MIVAIWVAVIVCAFLAVELQPKEEALASFGAILAASVATVSVVHLIRASSQGFVRELIYVSGGSYLFLALLSGYLLLKG